MSKNWKRAVLLSLVLSTLTWSCSTVQVPSKTDVRANALTKSGSVTNDGFSETVRIMRVNGKYAIEHATIIDVHPGSDIINISADVFNVSEGGLTAENRGVDEFRWTADDFATDICNTSDHSSCLDNSNFEVSDRGVKFHVPFNMVRRITLSVMNSNSPNAGSDAIILNPIQDYTKPPRSPAAAPRVGN